MPARARRADCIASPYELVACGALDEKTSRLKDRRLRHVEHDAVAGLALQQVLDGVIYLRDREVLGLRRNLASTDRHKWRSPLLAHIRSCRRIRAAGAHG